jgi:hypothetical protein
VNLFAHHAHAECTNEGVGIWREMSSRVLDLKIHLINEFALKGVLS